MRDFLLASCPIAIWCITALELILTVLMYKKYAENKGTKNGTLMLCTALITTGLFIDALGISLGSVLSGTIMTVISRIRFISHGILIPLLFPICAYALNFNGTWKKIIWVLTGILMVAGLAEALATVLEMSTIAGVTRFKAGEATPGWASGISNLLSFGTVIPLMIAGIVVWIKQKTPFLFLSGFFMFAFSALGPASGNADLIFYISMYGEILMVLFLYLYALKKSKE